MAETKIQTQVLNAQEISDNFEVEAFDEKGTPKKTSIAGEHPLTLYVNKQELVTLMTLGQKPDALALGYLRNQRLIDNPKDISSIQIDWSTNACSITTISSLSIDLTKKVKKTTITTGCGQGTVFGDLKKDLKSITLSNTESINTKKIYNLLSLIRDRETVYKTAGAVHGCALANENEIIYFIEDVGRHNAVDTIAGQMWLDDVDGDNKIFYTTGRLTSEMVIKCGLMEIPILISRSGLTQMGWTIAKDIGLTMIGRAVGKHFLLFTGKTRFKK